MQYRKVYFIRHKNEVAVCFEKYVKFVHTGNMIKTIIDQIMEQSTLIKLLLMLRRKTASK